MNECLMWAANILGSSKKAILVIYVYNYSKQCPSKQIDTTSFPIKVHRIILVPYYLGSNSVLLNCMRVKRTCLQMNDNQYIFALFQLSYPNTTDVLKNWRRTLSRIHPFSSDTLELWFTLSDSGIGTTTHQMNTKLLIFVYLFNKDKKLNDQKSRIPYRSW